MWLLQGCCALWKFIKFCSFPILFRNFFSFSLHSEHDIDAELIHLPKKKKKNLIPFRFSSLHFYYAIEIYFLSVSFILFCSLVIQLYTYTYTHTYAIWSTIVYYVLRIVIRSSLKSSTTKFLNINWDIFINIFFFVGLVHWIFISISTPWNMQTGFWFSYYLYSLSSFSWSSGILVR